MSLLGQQMAAVLEDQGMSVAQQWVALDAEYQWWAMHRLPKASAAGGLLARLRQASPKYTSLRCKLCQKPRPMPLP